MRSWSRRTSGAEPSGGTSRYAPVENVFGACPPHGVGDRGQRGFRIGFLLAFPGFMPYSRPARFAT